jgi:hypothetical protein
MFKRSTTIVVGAGASCEVGLPSGDGLKQQIVSLLHPDRTNLFGFANDEMKAAAQRTLGDDMGAVEARLAPLMSAADRLRRGLPLAMSIDNFLHAHHGDVEVERLGKLAIAMCILRAERQSHLFPHVPVSILGSGREPPPAVPALSRDELATSWYPAFVQLLTSQVQRHDVDAAFANIRFVIFNYDRCLEHYLWMALQAYFAIDGHDAARVLGEVEFIHPYGSLGALPWQPSACGPAVPLGGAKGINAWTVAAGLRTFTESVESETADRVAEAVSEADTLLVLGFGYHEQNLRLLAPPTGGRAQQLLSTAYGMSPQDQQVIRRAIAELGSVKPDETLLDPGSCRDLFDHNRLMLSLS